MRYAPVRRRDPQRARRHRHPGDHADRRRQVALLPAARAELPRRDARHLAADRADEGSGRFAAARGPGATPLINSSHRPTRSAGRDWRSPRRLQAGLRRAGAAAPGHLPSAATGGGDGPLVSSTRRTASASGDTTSGPTTCIPGARRALGEPPLLAMTATATPRMADGIKDGLSASPTSRALSLFRPNLRYEVRTAGTRGEGRERSICPRASEGPASSMSLAAGRRGDRRSAAAIAAWRRPTTPGSTAVSAPSDRTAS